MTPRAREHRFRRLKELGCIACWTIGVMDVPAEIHHQNLDGKAGQKRLGDECTVPLCPWHHQSQPMYGLTSERMRSLYGPSLKLHSRAFRLQFGRDEAMLAKVNDLIRIRDDLANGVHHRSEARVDIDG